MDVTHWSVIVSVGGNNNVDVFYDTLESLVELLRVQLQLQQSPVHLVHEQNRLDALGDGLPEHGFGLDAHT